MTVAIRQFRFDLLSFLRNPAALFFTVALPVVFFLLFVTIFGNGDIRVGGQTIKQATYYVPGIVTLGLIAATFQSLVVGLVAQRESGVLKRMRATPVPVWAVIAGRIGVSVVIAIITLIVVTVLGKVAYDTTIPGDTLIGVLVALVVGAAAFSCLAFALASFVPSENAAAPITNAVLLPLYFISGNFVPIDQIPRELRNIGDFFPVRHLFDAMLKAYQPGTAAPGIAWGDLAIVAVWGVLGLVVAAKFFKWEPRGR